MESESEAEKALCGKLETYLIRFCLVIQVMRGICGEADMNEIDEESADRAIRLTEYFRAMESRIAPEMEVGMLTSGTPNCYPSCLPRLPPPKR